MDKEHNIWMERTFEQRKFFFVKMWNICLCSDWTVNSVAGNIETMSLEMRI
jgi:hypothetical protein